MRILLLVLILFSNELFSQDLSRKICPNKTVYVVADKTSFKKIKDLFMLMSSLPYDVQLISKNDKNVTMAITHLIEGENPNAWELQSNVRNILKDRIKDYKITKYSVNFSPNDKCK